MCFCVPSCDVSRASFRYEQYVEEAYVAFLKQKGQAEQVCLQSIDDCNTKSEMRNHSSHTGRRHLARLIAQSS